MSGHLELEETGTAKAADNLAALNFVDSTRNSMSPKEYSNTLQAFNKDTSVLPSLQLMDAKTDAPAAFKGDVPPPPVIHREGTSDADLKQYGVTRIHSKDGTETDFENKTIKVTTGGKGADVHMPDGTTMHMSGAIHVDAKGTHESKPGSGDYVDASGKLVYTDNKDGSATIYDKNGVYVARNDGTVSKLAEVKNPDGTWNRVVGEGDDGSSPIARSFPKNELGSTKNSH